MRNSSPTGRATITTRRGVLRAGSVLASAGLAGCSGVIGLPGGGNDEFPPGHETAWADPVSIGDGEAKTFVAETSAGELGFIGVRFTAAALSGLAEGGAPSHNHLDVPADADTGAFEWLGMDWNPSGHEPPGIYDVPHFDFHFYTMASEDVEAISGGPATYDIPADQLPAGYIRPPAIDADGDGKPDTPAIVPGMGEHLLDPTSPELNGESFTHTFIWGAHDPALLGGGETDGSGQLTFMEPMITTAFFEERNAEVATEIGMPRTFPEPGRYPTEYVIRYYDDQDAYTVSLESFESFE